MIPLVHPLLPAGFNFDAVNVDEFNGAGVNDPIYPELFDTFEGLTVLRVDAEDMAVFDSECPDLVIPRANDNLVITPDWAPLYVGRSG